MICPRCGLVVNFTPCRLCGLNDFDDFELNRYKEQRSGRFECTLVIWEKDLIDWELKSAVDAYRHVYTDEMNPRCFVFFSDDDHEQLFEFLKLIHRLHDWSLMINGRIRPFSRELWLPLLELAK